MSRIAGLAVRNQCMFVNARLLIDGEKLRAAVKAIAAGRKN